MALIKREIMYYNEYYNLNLFMNNKWNSCLKENLIVIKSIKF